MLDLLRAEWKKVNRNFRITAFLVWIVPVGMVAFFTVMIILGFFSEGQKQISLSTSTGQWTTDMLSIWDFVGTFPSNILYELLPLAFVAVVFAGEYQWGTWRNLLPRTRRTYLILVKLVIVVTLVMISLVLTSVFNLIGYGLIHQSVGVSYGPELNNDVLQGFLSDGLVMVFVTLIIVTFLAGFGMLAAIATRSILGGLMVSFVIVLFEGLSRGLLQLLSIWFKAPGLVRVGLYLPSYNLENLRSWLLLGKAQIMELAGLSMQVGLGFSFAVLAVWLVGLVGLTLFVFERQDITA
jgi:hypothetical protein